MDAEFIAYLDFKTLGDNKLEAMQNSVAQFMAELIENKHPRWLSLLGSSGTGKTHLTKKLFNEFNSKHKYYMGKPDPLCDIEITQRREITFFDSSFIANTLRSGDYSIMSRLKSEHLIVIDDFGSEMDTEFMVAKWIEILHSRERKWTMINSNYSLSEIAEQMDKRIASRFIRDRNTVIDCNTTDYGFRGVQK